MRSKKLYEQKKKELLLIMEDNSLDAVEKLDKIKILELLENLEIYQTELSAQNSELREKEQELLESRDEFEKLYNFAPVAYLLLDKEFKILKFNNKALELFSNTNLSFKINNQLNFYIHKDDMISYITFLSKLKKDGSNEGVIKFIGKDELLHCRVHMKKYEKDKKTFYLMSVIDISIEVKQEAMILSQAKKAAMGEMLNMITHQWKQPLSIIGVNNSIMEVEIELNDINSDRFKEYIKEIHTQIEYMKETADDFKSFFDKSVELERLNVRGCIDRAIRFTSASLKNNDISLELKYEKEDEDYSSFGFKHDICQILMIIINNAKDILIKKDINRKINIAVYKKDTKIVVTIKNNGGIINENIIKGIFDEGFSSKDERSGNGLGLYIAQKIVNEHLKGKLYVENIKDEDSVIFYLETPQYKQKE